MNYTQKEVMEMTGVSRSTISILTHALVEMGYAKKAGAPVYSNKAIDLIRKWFPKKESK